MKVLIIEDDEISLEIMENILQTAGYQTCTAADGLKGLEAYERFNPDLVITDIEMPGMNGLEVLGEIRDRSAETIVVMATGNGSEDYALRALRLHANDYLRKPVDQNHLLVLMQKYARAVESRRNAREVLGCIVRSEIEFSFGNSMDLMFSVVDYLMAQASGFLSKDDLPMVRLGLAEILTNAIEHGNLEITAEEKSQAMATTGLITQLFAERLADPRLAKRRVTVRARLSEEACEWVIRDEGDGFDWQTRPTQFDADSLFAYNGRGILISQMQFDEMEYLGKGNEVRLVKHVRNYS